VATDPFPSEVASGWQPGASSLLCASSPRPSRRCTNLLSAGVSPFGGQRIVFKTRATPDNIGLVSSDGAKGGSNVHRRLLAATAEFERGFVSRTSFFGELKRQARPSNAARLSSVTSKLPSAARSKMRLARSLCDI